jgi:hypothetical protein
MKYPEEIYLERAKAAEAALQTAMNDINVLKDALAQVAPSPRALDAQEIATRLEDDELVSLKLLHTAAALIRKQAADLVDLEDAVQIIAQNTSDPWARKTLEQVLTP